MRALIILWSLKAIEQSGSTKAFERFTSLAKLVSSEINSQYIFFTVSSSLLPTLGSEMDIS